MIQVCNIVKAMHKLRFVHNDLKLTNFTETSTGKFYIVDFESISGQNGYPADLSTTGYMAPERIGGTVSFTQSDIYSLGITFSCIVSNHSSQYCFYCLIFAISKWCKRITITTEEVAAILTHNRDIEKEHKAKRLKNNSNSLEKEKELKTVWDNVIGPQFTYEQVECNKSQITFEKKRNLLQQMLDMNAATRISLDKVITELKEMITLTGQPAVTAANNSKENAELGNKGTI